MATRAQEAEILQGGTRSGSTTPGAFVLNMLNDEGSWEVRKGFGQVAQFDTSMSQNIPGATTDWGYQKHLGSHYMKTNFGHEQIITLLASKNITSMGERYPEIHYLYIVNIYDVTTGERWEEVVFRQTCENANTGYERLTGSSSGGAMFSPPYWHGVYETSWDKSYQSWASAQSGAKKVGFHKEPVLIGGQAPPYFVEFGDILYFGTKETGPLAYIPSTFRGNRLKGVNDVYRHEWNDPYSESAVIRRVPAVPGIEAEFFDYYNQGNFPTPSCAAKFVNRFVWGSGRFLFFSDEGFVSSTVIENTVEIPCDGEITALVEVGGSVVIFTQSETWAYRPSTSFIATSGVLERISSHVGCLSPSAIAKFEGGTYWADVNGCYGINSALQMSTLSDPISDFFSSSLTNPVTSYYGGIPGYTSLSTQQPRTSARMDSDGVNVTFAPSISALLVNVPSQNVTLCFTGEQWSVWTYTSNVYTVGSVDLPGITGGADTDNPEGPIFRPWVVASQSDVWLVGNIDKQSMNDVSATNDDTLSSSYCVMRYGRGGAIDRSVDSWDVNALNKKGREDNREFPGKYNRFASREFASPYDLQDFNPDASVFLERPVEVNQSFVFSNGNYSGATAAALKGPAIPASGDVRIALLPVWAAIKWSVLNAAGGGRSGESGASVTIGAIEKLELAFEVDNSVWAPVFRLTGSQGDAHVSYILPPERTLSAPAISVNCYSDYDLTTPSVTGAYVKVVLDAAALSGDYGEFNLSDGKRGPLVYVPFYTTSTGALSGILKRTGALPTIRCSVSDVGAVRTAYPSVYVWDQMIATGSMRTEDDVALPVDWAYKGEAVATGDGTRIKSRGLVSVIQSRGPATDLIDSSWDFGVFNSVVAADLKGWTSQVVDYVGAEATPVISVPKAIEKIAKKTGIRTRVMPSGGTLADRTFSSSGTSVTKPAWGNTSPVGSQGNFLIDDEEVSEIVTSDSVKGDRITYMVFGHMQNRANALGLGSIKMLFRALGFLRRTGK